MKYNAVYGQSGGPTSVINSSLYGVIEEVKKHEEIETLFLMHNGIKGLINDDLKDYKEIPQNEIDLLTQTPSAICGSVRHKLASFEENDEEYQKIINVLKKHNIKYIYLNGGNDSMDTGKKLFNYFKKINFDCKVIGIPKTIDNDLILTDHTPGYPSSAKFIANVIKSISYDNDCYIKGRVNIVEIMGRDAGWLTASSALAYPYGPDLIYVPEIYFDTNKFLEDVKTIYEKKHRCLVAVSEGIRTKDNKFIFTQKAKDVFSHQQLGGVGVYLASLVEEKLHYSTRGIELSLLQRCYAQTASKNDIDEAIECGRRAVQYSLNGLTGIMVTMERKDNKIEYNYNSLEKIANSIKFLPRNMINEKGNNVSPLFFEYASILLNKDNDDKYENGILKFSKKNYF